MTQRFYPKQEEDYPQEVYDSRVHGSEFSPAYMNQQQAPQHPINKQQPQQPVQQKPKNNKGVDITFRYNEQTQTYKKLRIEKDGDNFLLVVVEGQKGKGNNKVVIQLGLDDLIKIKWIIDNELKRKEETFKL